MHARLNAIIGLPSRTIVCFVTSCTVRQMVSETRLGLPIKFPPVAFRAGHDICYKMQVTMKAMYTITLNFQRQTPS